MLKTSPAVFTVGNDYEIMVPVTANSLFWVKVGEESFYDEQNGVMRSLCTTHRVTVPASALDKAGSYTVCEREIIDRCPYFPVTADTVETVFPFRPLPKHDIRAYHIADAHSIVDKPVAAANAFGNIDLLILNGDIPDHSGDIDNYDTIYRIIEELTHGSIPVVFARGNHDLRGYYAERMAEHTPNSGGNTYYTFRAGSIWGIVLDCGEDKDDGHEEYGGTVSCHGFRVRQTEFIRSVIKNAENEYAADGITHRLVICHNPFTFRLGDPFNIEKEIYSEWAKMLKESIKPNLMLCGHLHRLAVSQVGGELDMLGQPCPLIVGSSIRDNYHAGCGLVFKDNGEIESVFTDSDGNKIN